MPADTVTCCGHSDLPSCAERTGAEKQGGQAEITEGKVKSGRETLSTLLTAPSPNREVSQVKNNITEIHPLTQSKAR